MSNTASLQQLKILRALSSSEDGLTMKQVIDSTNLKTPSVSANLVRMRGKGYVTKQEVSGLWRISDSGEDLLAEAREALTESVA